jgi:hypothetical protein
MKKSMYFGVMAIILAFALVYVTIANAQNVTSNASNATGNASAGANKTGSEFGMNASKGGGEVANKTENIG